MLRLDQKINGKALSLVSLLLFSMMLLSLDGFSQEYEIKGKVIDVDGKPVPGVTILIKGTVNGTAANMEGNFALNVPYESTLLFSFIGYKSIEQEITYEKGFIYELKVNLAKDKLILKQGKSSVEIIKRPSPNTL